MIAYQEGVLIPYREGALIAYKVVVLIARCASGDVLVYLFPGLLRRASQRVTVG